MTRTTTATFTLASLVLTLACARGGSDSSESSYGSGAPEGGEDSTTAATATSTSDGSSESADDASDTAEDTGDPLYWDVLGIPDAPPDTGCKRVDFMFVVDNSPSMADEQEALKASWPAAVAELQVQLAEVLDYNIMGLDTDNRIHNCQSICMAVDDACAPIIPLMNGIDLCLESPADDWWGDIGCGVNFPVGQQASNTGCLYDPFEYDPNDVNPIDRPSYLSGTAAELSEGSFVDDVQCIIDMGIDGDIVERPLQAMSYAAGLTGWNECNTGFLRDDAALVIVLITDEDDASDFSPEGYVRNVVKMKLDDPNDPLPTAEELEDAASKIALLAIVDYAGGVVNCDVDGTGPQRIMEGIEQLPNKKCAAINAPAYGPTLVAFIQENVVSACAEIQG
ncbi:hypothetical protein ACNOYE_34835 [Nannocystaceae bacterium ST9]